MADRKRILHSSLDSIRDESRSPGLSAELADAATQDAFMAPAVPRRTKWSANRSRALSSRDKSREHDTNMRKCMSDITAAHDAWKRAKTDMDDFITLPSVENPTDEELPFMLSYSNIKSSIVLTKLEKMIALVHYQEKLLQEERARQLGV